MLEKKYIISYEVRVGGSKKINERKISQGLIGATYTLENAAEKWEKKELELKAKTRVEAADCFTEWKNKMNHLYQRSPKLYEKRTELIFLSD